MKKRIAVLPGDGIGKEVSESAILVLKNIAERYGHEFEFENGLVGGCAIDECGTPLPDETIDLCKNSDAILLGAVGGPKWDHLPGDQRPEKGLLGLRKSLDLFANLRPVKVFSSLARASTLKLDVVKDVDLLIVRELTGGLYVGKPSERLGEHGDAVVDTLHYTRDEMVRIIEKGFELARVRRGKLTSVDKANVLESSRMWREIVEESAAKYRDVQVEHRLVDDMAMQLIRNPKQFDVVVTENLFGDILSDEASMLTGSLGMLPSASLSGKGPGLFEPVHGSAPDIAGQNRANPLAMILSAAMMLKYAFRLDEEASAVEAAVEAVLNEGYRTADIAEDGLRHVSTSEMTENVISKL